MSDRLLPSVVISLLLSSLAGCNEDAPSAGLLDTITAERLRTHVEWLSDDALEGRFAGEPGYDEAAKYVAARFDDFGVAPGGEQGFYQPVPLIRYRLDTETPRVELIRDGETTKLEYREDYGMGADKVRRERGVRGEVVYVGYGVHAPEFGYSDYDGIDVDGRIVALFGGAPSTFPHAERAYYASSRTKAKEAVGRGAVGTIRLRSRRIDEQYPWERYRRETGTKPGMAWVTGDGSASDYFPEIEGSITLSSTAAAELFDGAPLTFEEARAAAAADTQASMPLGVEVAMSGETRHDRIYSPNVIGVVPGSDPALAGEYVVYTAHLDAVGTEANPEGDDAIVNGAYDNAMGVSIMLETARVFAKNPPARSTLFIALTAEERGLLGSDYFAHHPTVPIDNIVANVNLDMPLFLYPVADLVAFGSEHSSLEAVVEQAAEAENFVLTPNPLPEENLFVRSDQYSFVRQGVPAIYLIPGFNSTDPSVDSEAAFREHLKNHYHQPSDDLTRPVDWPSVVRFTRSHVRIGYAISNEADRPTWNDGDFFGERFGPEPMESRQSASR